MSQRTAPFNYPEGDGRSRRPAEYTPLASRRGRGHGDASPAQGPPQTGASPSVIHAWMVTLDALVLATGVIPHPYRHIGGAG
jgi:hypothetical protein